jgi:hypothetical protein
MFYAAPSNKQRLLHSLKKDGEYLAFNPKQGFIYRLQVGISNGLPVLIKVSIKNGLVNILDVFLDKQPALS